MNTYGKGTHLFCDFLFGGKPSAVCLEVIEPGRGRYGGEGKIKVKLTETTGAYRKGEVLVLTSHEAVPKKQERPLRHGEIFRRIKTDYEWVTSTTTPHANQTDKASPSPDQQAGR